MLRGGNELMSEKYILYNPCAGGPETEKAVKALQDANEGAVAINICRIIRYKTFFNGLDPNDTVILCGGDGTLNRFVNDVNGMNIPNKLYYYPTGTGNDFARDVGQKPFSDPTVCLNPYFERLPRVSVKGKSELFLNNVGFGIDGYCCEVGEKLREENKKRKKPKPVNYTKIAITGLLFHYKPKNVTVVVDGKRYQYKKVWLASVMNGRFYGGGMMPTPEQYRLREDGKVSILIFHDVGKLRGLMIFPSIFSGKHLKYTNQMTILEGKTIQVKYNEPAPLQIDGEVVPEVMEYTVRSCVSPAEKAKQDSEMAAV